jgi:hypothetical protein
MLGIILNYKRMIDEFIIQNISIFIRLVLNIQTTEYYYIINITYKYNKYYYIINIINTTYSCFKLRKIFL